MFLFFWLQRYKTLVKSLAIITLQQSYYTDAISTSDDKQFCCSLRSFDFRPKSLHLPYKQRRQHNTMYMCTYIKNGRP
jgi:hypothetical protein